jgi:hypothetical protein
MAVQVLDERTAARARGRHYAGPATIHRRSPGADKLARGLGAFSLGLAAAFLARPGGTARFSGLKEGLLERGVIAAVGLREIPPGLGLLMQGQPAGWAWGRTAGDVMDVAFVGCELLWGRAKEPRRAAAAFAWLLFVTGLDAFCAKRMGMGAGGAPQVAAVTVDGSPEEVAARWSGGAYRPAFRPAPAGRGTEVSVEVPRKEHGDALAVLRRFKQTYEAGEVARAGADA